MNSARSLFFIKKKRKIKEKGKDLHGLGLAHNEAGLIAKIRPKSEKDARSDLNILH